MGFSGVLCVTLCSMPSISLNKIGTTAFVLIKENLKNFISKTKIDMKKFFLVFVVYT